MGDEMPYFEVIQHEQCPVLADGIEHMWMPMKVGPQYRILRCEGCGVSAMSDSSG